MCQFGCFSPLHSWEEEEEEEEEGCREFISPIQLLLSLSQLLQDLRFSPRRATMASPRNTGT